MDLYDVSKLDSCPICGYHLAHTHEYNKITHINSHNKQKPIEKNQQQVTKFFSKSNRQGTNKII